MIIKYLYWLGLAACVMLVISCFMPWVYFPALNETFTGVQVKKFANGNYYGRAGYPIMVLTVIVATFMLTKKVWAKRANFFVAGLLFAYVCRTYMVFTGSLFKGEVITKAGMYLVVLCSAIMLIAAVFPDMKMSSKK